MSEVFLNEREQAVADLAQQYVDLKNECKQLLQAQVVGAGYTLRQLDDEFEALKEKLTEQQGSLSPTDDARLNAILVTPEVLHLSRVRRKINETIIKYYAAKRYAEQDTAAVSNKAQDSPKMVDAALIRRRVGKPHS